MQTLRCEARGYDWDERRCGNDNDLDDLFGRSSPVILNPKDLPSLIRLSGILV